MASRKPTEEPHDEVPLTQQELRHLRGMLLDDDRATWARKRIGVFIPWFVAVITGLWSLYEILSKHFKP
jgi:hypothetical protein